MYLSTFIPTHKLYAQIIHIHFSTREFQMFQNIALTNLSQNSVKYLEFGNGYQSNKPCNYVHTTQLK